MAQVATRVRLVAAAPTRSRSSVPVSGGPLLIDVVLQRKTISERPLAGLAHALVFWGSWRSAATRDRVLMGSASSISPTQVVPCYMAVLTPFAVGVLAGIVYL